MICKTLEIFEIVEKTIGSESMAHDQVANKGETLEGNRKEEYALSCGNFLIKKKNKSLK